VHYNPLLLGRYKLWKHLFKFDHKTRIYTLVNHNASVEVVYGFWEIKTIVRSRLLVYVALWVILIAFDVKKGRHC
jgi:hypothetical protein